MPAPPNNRLQRTALRAAAEPEWFGSAFRQLECAPALMPSLSATLAATSWRDREQALTTAFEMVATLHNALGLTDPIVAKVQPFFSRPFMSIATRGFADAVAARIGVPEVQRLLVRPWLGGIDQISDNSDLLESPIFRSAVRMLYA
ncbi:MAG: hypothetical protein H7062_14780 [Candidatus Saccharimonas sp.]|nr:hypothetical protein [Planctomycetaceae bacterium]